MAFQQAIEVRLKNGKRFRTEICIPTSLGNRRDRIRWAIARLSEAGGIWWSGVFVSWNAVWCTLPVDSLTLPEKNDGSRNK